MIGLSGPDHAVARRDGDGRRRDAAARPEDAAADRRRDDQQGAYRAADRSGLRRPGHPRARRQPRGRRRLVAGLGHAARAADRDHRRRLRQASQVARAQRPERARDASTKRAPTAFAFDPSGQAPRAAISGPAPFRRLAAQGPARPRSTGRRSSARGSWPATIRRSSTIRSSAKARATCSTTRRRCSTS